MVRDPLFTVILHRNFSTPSTGTRRHPRRRVTRSLKPLPTLLYLYEPVLWNIGIKSESPYQLPTFKGYTIDVKLRQFRKVSHGEQPNIDFIDFDSERGQQLLEEMRASIIENRDRMNGYIQDFDSTILKIKEELIKES